MKNLQRIRLEKGLSQSQLARLSYVPLPMIQKYEIGAKNINRAQALTVVKLAMILKCEVIDLLELDDYDMLKG